MNEKDEALADAMRLVLADAFEAYARIPPGLQRVAAIPCVVSRTELSQAARLLRRLHAENERLREALELAFSCHGKVLMSDPPQDAWKFHRVNEVIAAALRREEA